MKLLHVTILIIAIQYSTARQNRPTNHRPVLSLQNIISAGNKEKAIQMMQLKKSDAPVAGMTVSNVPASLPNQQKMRMAPNVVQNLRSNPVPKIPCQKEPEIIRVPVPYPVPVKEECPSFSSPFLPLASPVSAWAPSNGLLPPVVPNQSRNHFLRKIPIPPPTL